MGHGERRRSINVDSLGLVGITNSYCPLCKADMKWTGEYSPFQQLVHDVEAMKAHIKYLCVAQIEKDNGKDSLPSDTLAYPPFTLTLLLSPLFFLLFSSFSFFFFFV